MDRAALQQLLQESESLLHREDIKIAHQRDLIATLERRGRDATAARLLLRRLESQHARHIADRNRLFKAWADSRARQ